MRRRLDLLRRGRALLLTWELSVSGLAVGEKRPHQLCNLNRADDPALPDEELLQGRLELPSIVVPVRRGTRERAHHHAIQLRGDVRHVRRRLNGTGERGLQRPKLRVALQGANPGQKLVQNEPNGEDVRAVIQRLPTSLLRGHVCKLSLDGAGLRHRVGVRGLGDPEVDHLDRAVEGDEQILRGDVAVDHLEGPPLVVHLGVGVREPFTCRGHNPQSERAGNPLPRAPGLAHHPSEVLAVDVLHGDVVVPVDLPEVENLPDVRVAELRRDFRLVEEHPDEVRILRQMGEDSLDYNLPLEPLDTGLLRQPHLGHTARGQLPHQLVFAEGLSAQGMPRRRRGMLGDTAPPPQKLPAF